MIVFSEGYKSLRARFIISDSFIYGITLFVESDRFTGTIRVAPFS